MRETSRETLQEQKHLLGDNVTLIFDKIRVARVQPSLVVKGCGCNRVLLAGPVSSTWRGFVTE